MLHPYIIEKSILRFVGRSVRGESEIPTLFGQMDETFSRIENPIGEAFCGISQNFANGSPDSTRTYWLCKEVSTLQNPDGTWIRLQTGMEALVLPATRWLHVPVRYDDPFVQDLAPAERREDTGYLTVCVFTWARQWLLDNGYRAQDFPYELEIYGLHDGYGDGEAHLTLALPMQ